MKLVYAGFAVSIAAAVFAGCALHPIESNDVYAPNDREKSLTQTVRAPAPVINSAFEKADTDNNGVVSKEESVQVPGLTALFDRFNRNRNGSLDWTEFTEAFQSGRLLKN